MAELIAMIPPPLTPTLKGEGKLPRAESPFPSREKVRGGSQIPPTHEIWHA